jgi:hypothetical protein
MAHCIQRETEMAMPWIRCKLVGLFATLLLAIAPTLALAQARQVREGVTLYLGLVPAAVVAEKHALEDMHGAVPRGGGQNHHLVIALFDADGKRIVDAVVQAQLHEIGIVDAPRKYLTPMIIDGQASYGQLFSTVKDGPYQFRLFVKLPKRAADVEFSVSAWSPQREAR